MHEGLNPSLLLVGVCRLGPMHKLLPRSIGTKFGVVEGLKGENDTPSHHERTIINQLPDWSMLLAAITTIFLAAEKQWMMLDWKPRRPDMLTDPFGLGKIVQDGLVFSQNFSIRSYEVGADRTASIETLMNHLQETALNHVKGAGLLGDGFGATPEMCKKNLIWVVTKMHVVVDRYPTWGDVVQVNSWVAASGKNGMRRDWIVHDCKTGDILTRASRSMSAPPPILESHELSSLTLEYRRECGRDSVLQSLTKVSGGGGGGSVDSGYVECEHMLRLEDGPEILKARTEWRPKYANILGSLGQLSELSVAESA
ncbi:hypothetical protein HYC85_016012 [Camellia sinensis]|uniref:Acyl-[acyl-carrier-protein] hydrolase n=1 Tax=Camellia sinensis TaxID=4442 RepID=A0A7J7H1T5_CAMSI|nr:hypothetical protein HYC85_016012 [Camellia sinensis]